MGNRAPLAPNEFYHIYNRGTEKRRIFLNKGDYERFLALLYIANCTEPIKIDNIRRNERERGSTLLSQVLGVERGKPLVSLAAYCLMPNHFHLLLRQETENGISRFMQKLTTAYTMYFNTKYERTGSLFQGKFKSEHAADDRYLKYLLAYIHLNPSKFTDASRYPYSSYADFAGERRPQTKILKIDILPEYFPTPKKFAKEMREWLGDRPHLR